jgi:hypothetical protein
MDCNTKKQYMVCVRVTLEQLNTLRQQSIDNNLSMSDYIRNLIINRRNN